MTANMKTTLLNAFFSGKNYCILIEISLKFTSMGRIDNTSSQLSEPMIALFTDASRRH